MRKISYTLLLLVTIAFLAYTIITTNESVPLQFVDEIKTQSTPLATTVIEPSVATLTPESIMTDTSVDTSGLATTTVTSTPETITTYINSEPILIATIKPDSYSDSSIPENIWWSEDSQTLFYQDIETQQAWAYDLFTGKTDVISYVPRSFRELKAQIEATLPENANLFSLSPSSENILYRVPLSESILNLEDSHTPNDPPYSYELWLRRNGQDFQLGLVDSCFGILGPAKWSANENIAIINTAGVPGMQCIHSSWLVDVDTLSVGALDTPWEGGENFYSVNDLSADGDLLLVRAEINYFYDRNSKEQVPVSNVDTANIILIDTSFSPSCLFLEKAFSDVFFRTHIWYCEPITGKMPIVATIETNIVDWIVSPNNEFIALIGGGQDILPELQELPSGIWLMDLSRGD